MRTPYYPPNPSPYAEKLATFAQQMADYARGDQLRALRLARHLSQEDAAHEIGVTTKALRAWEKGGRIKWENAKSAATFYEVDPESLVTRESTDELPVLVSQSQLDRIEGELGAIRVEIGTLSSQLAELQRLTAQIAETVGGTNRSRKAK